MLSSLVAAPVLAQRERVFFRDPGDGERALLVPVLPARFFVAGPDGVEVRFKARHGGSVSLRGRLLASWIVGSENWPVTFAEEPGDLVLDEVVRGGRLGVRLFTDAGRGVLLLLEVGRRRVH